MTKLEFLWITDNKLQQISNSGDAMGLKYVHLERNRLSNLNLYYFQNSLKRLYLDHNLFTEASQRTLGLDICFSTFITSDCPGKPSGDKLYPIQGHQKNDLDNFESLSMNYNNLKYASIVQDLKNLRILYLEGNELTFVPKFHDENDITSFRLDLR